MGPYWLPEAVGRGELPERSRCSSPGRVSCGMPQPGSGLVSRTPGRLIHKARETGPMGTVLCEYVHWADRNGVWVAFPKTMAAFLPG